MRKAPQAKAKRIGIMRHCQSGVVVAAGVVVERGRRLFLGIS
jgi:hypothetical protein